MDTADLARALELMSRLIIVELMRRGYSVELNAVVAPGDTADEEAFFKVSGPDTAA